MDLSINSEYKFPNYEEMVLNLFKIDIPGNRSDLMHAAIGIAGESGEILEAVDRINLFEEFGDMEFYVEALKQRLDRYGFDLQFNREGTPYRQSPPNFKDIDYRLVIVISACSILDAIKKCWIYNDREPKMEMIAPHIYRIEDALACGYALNMISREEILFGNQVKLIGKDGRYKTGKYSDEQALARADKMGEGEAKARAVLAAGDVATFEPGKLAAGTMEGSPKVDLATLPAGDTATFDPNKAQDTRVPTRHLEANIMPAGDTAPVPSAADDKPGTGTIVVDGTVKTYSMTEVKLPKE